MESIKQSISNVLVQAAYWSKTELETIVPSASVHAVALRLPSRNINPQREAPDWTSLNFLEQWSPTSHRDQQVDLQGIPSQSPNISAKTPTIKPCVTIYYYFLSRAVVGRCPRFSCNARRVGKPLPFWTISWVWSYKHCLPGRPREQISIGLPLANRMAQMTVSGIT